MQPNVERRAFNVELRAADADQPRTISGYAALFNTQSEDLGGYREIIAPGAFTECLGDDVRCLFNHDANVVLGRTKSGTLKLEQDDKGLRFTCILPDTDAARSVAESMNRGDLDQCSFAFTVAKGGSVWSEENDTPIRTVVRCSGLFDVSVVTYPAYTETSASIRSAADILSERTARPAANDGGADLTSYLRRIDLSLIAD